MYIVNVKFICCGVLAHWLKTKISGIRIIVCSVSECFRRYKAEVLTCLSASYFSDLPITYIY